MRKFYILIVLVMFGSGIGVVPGATLKARAANEAFAPTLLISEIQVTGVDSGGAEIGEQEFIEVYNPADEPLDATGWRIEYLSANNDGSGTPTRVLSTLNVVVSAGAYLLFSYQDYLTDADGYFGTSGGSGWLAKSGGHVRIVDTGGHTIDAVQWGSAVTLKARPAPTLSWWHAPSIAAGLSIWRILAGEAAYSDGLAFASPGDPSPHGGNLPLPPAPPETNPPVEPPSDPSPPNPDPVEPSLDCGSLMVTEIMPNPAGSDTGHEFIEIHNPTNQTISLRGCSLRVGEGDSFTLPAEPLAPGAYRAFYDSETGLTLPNATAQAVWLIGPTSAVSVLYPNALGDDQSWSYFEGQWEMSDQPTPGKQNVRMTPNTSPVVTSTPKVKGASAPISCPLGKERNPATNRCRSIAVTVPLAPCKSGQTRSPETNRCRTTSGVVGGLKACPAGQARSPQSNRCRKKATVQTAHLAEVRDVNNAMPLTDARWWIAGLIAAGAAGYALYEWRRDIVAALHKLKKVSKHR